MDLSKRLVLVKSTAKEDEYSAFTPDDVISVWEHYQARRSDIKPFRSL